MKIKRFINNSKAISPIFATLILIAIAVIAGVVVYMFTSGTLATMTGGGTAAQEKVSIQAVQVTAPATTGIFAPGSTGNFISVYAQSQSGTVTITNAIVKDSSGNVVGTLPTTDITYLNGATAITSTLTTVKIAPASGELTLATGSNSYTITLISTKGGNFVSSAFSITA